MLFLLKFFKKEKFWVSVSLLFMLFGSFFTISQALLIANAATFTINLNSLKDRIKKEDYQDSKHDDISVVAKLFKAVKILFRDGNQAMVEYVLSFKDFLFLFFLGVVCLIWLACAQLLLFFKDFANQYMVYCVSNRLRVYFVEHLMKLPTTTLKNKKSGEFLSRAISDIKQIEDQLSSFIESAIYGPALTLLGLVVLFYINLKFSLIVLFSIAVLGILVPWISKRLKILIRKLQEGLTDMTHHLQEIVYAIDIIKIFNREDYERTRFLNRTRKILSLLKKQMFINNLNRPLTEIVISLNMIGIIFFAAQMIWEDQLSLIEMFSFFAVLIYTTPYLQRMSNALFIRQRINVSSQRIEEVVEQFKVKTKGANLLEERPLIDLPNDYRGEVRFDRVSFSYDDQEEVLSDISFRAEPGEFVAFVGRSGAGKTTLLNLISSLIEPNQGTIYFDGLPHRELNLSSIRRQIALVSQESLLFPTSIEENILYGNLEASKEEFLQASRLAAVDQFVEKFSKGYQTEIGERGIKISGGQKQRICIARALIKKPKILLLDEATSSLDSESEQAIKQSFKQLLHEQTTFVIAHRLSTILEADKIVVIDKGKIEKIGGHQQLLQESKIYPKLYKLQFR